MSGYKNFAIVGAGTLGNYIIRQFLSEKAARTVNEVVVLTRQVSKHDPISWDEAYVPTDS
jgi:pyrroline-5-carboxylate reductase